MRAQGVERVTRRSAMKIGVFGTGIVGQTIATKLVALGHDVKMGSRTTTNEDAMAWAKAQGPRASHGTFADAARFGQLLFNCTLGEAALEVLKSAGADPMRGKVLVDLSNPLDFSHGMPPTLTVVSSDSLGEQIQRAFPATRVVKTLNTVSAPLMVDPSQVADGDHQLFLSGNDPAAKAEVAKLLTEGFGWKNVLDLGDITTARGPEAYLLLWTRLYMALGTPAFNLKLVR
jgi:predicted dinucleotide-binding enzyme